MQNICFVCDGNTCRSPFAEKMFNYYLKQYKVVDFKGFSCGIFADTNQNINPYVVQILQTHSIKVKSRKAKKLTNSCYKKYQLFVTMTKEQKSFVKSQNVVSLGELVGGEDIIDPYGKSYDEYIKMTEQVDNYVRLLVQKIVDKVYGGKK